MFLLLSLLFSCSLFPYLSLSYFTSYLILTSSYFASHHFFLLCRGRKNLVGRDPDGPARLYHSPSARPNAYPGPGPTQTGRPVWITPRLHRLPCTTRAVELHGRDARILSHPDGPSPSADGPSPSGSLEPPRRPEPVWIPRSSHPDGPARLQGPWLVPRQHDPAPTADRPTGGIIPDARGRRRAVAPARRRHDRRDAHAGAGRHSSPTAVVAGPFDGSSRAKDWGGAGTHNAVARLLLFLLLLSPRAADAPLLVPVRYRLSTHPPRRAARLSRAFAPQDCGLWTVAACRGHARPRGWEVCSSSWPVVVVGSSAIL